MIYKCKKCGRQVTKEPCEKGGTAGLGHWHCGCGGKAVTRSCQKEGSK